MGAGSFHKELHGIRTLNFLKGARSLSGQRKGGYAVDPLTIDTKRLARRGQKMKFGATAVEPVSEPSTGIYHVLAIIQDDEKALVREYLDEQLGHRSSGPLADPEGSGYYPWYLATLRDGRQVGKKDSFGVPTGGSPSDLYGKAGLAAAGRPSEGDQRDDSTSQLTSASSASRPMNVLG